MDHAADKATMLSRYLHESCYSMDALSRKVGHVTMFSLPNCWKLRPNSPLLKSLSMLGVVPYLELDGQCQTKTKLIQLFLFAYFDIVYGFY
jgi:hypothetical protein